MRASVRLTCERYTRARKDINKTMVPGGAHTRCCSGLGAPREGTVRTQQPKRIKWADGVDKMDAEVCDVAACEGWTGWASSCSGFALAG